MKELAGNKINITQQLKFDTEKLENIMGTGENASFLLFLCFQKDSLGHENLGLCGKGLKTLQKDSGNTAEKGDVAGNQYFPLVQIIFFTI